MRTEFYERTGGGTAVTCSAHTRRVWATLAVTALALAAFVGLPTPAAHAVTVVMFPDAGLESAVRSALAKPSGDITDVDMESLTELHPNELGITDLSGIEYATNLQRLFLIGNQITDITPLASLDQLTDLRLQGNRIADVAPLAGNAKLAILWLDGNQITDLGPLAGLKNLTQLRLGTNQISDLSPLAGLTGLVTLWLDGNQITDLSPLAGLNGLSNLYLDGNQITDISPLAGLSRVTYLQLGGNQITDISTIARLPKLSRLSLDSNQITDITPVLALKELLLLRVIENHLDTTPRSPTMNAVATLESRGVAVVYEPQQVTPFAVYRFYNKWNGSHFYTATQEEKDRVLKNLSASYSPEGVAFKGRSDFATPVYRFYNRRNGSHFYTASEAEKRSVAANLSAIYSYDGIAYRMSELPVAGSTPMYRFYDKRNGSHFYTACEAEKNNVRTKLAAVYALDGIAFYVAP
jgi:hypothetical protein